MSKIIYNPLESNKFRFQFTFDIFPVFQKRLNNIEKSDVLYNSNNNEMFEVFVLSKSAAFLGWVGNILITFFTSLMEIDLLKLSLLN